MENDYVSICNKPESLIHHLSSRQNVNCHNTLLTRANFSKLKPSRRTKVPTESGCVFGYGYGIVSRPVHSFFFRSVICGALSCRIIVLCRVTVPDEIMTEADRIRTLPRPPERRKSVFREFYDVLKLVAVFREGPIMISDGSRTHPIIAEVDRVAQKL